MILFKKIRWKNLLSTGNAFTEIDLNDGKTILFSGKNGHGKSTILDALTFVLFGKPFRKVNKPLLVNSVNGRDCVAEIEFTIGKHEYKIVRGIKPSIFEIYKNGKLVDQDAATRDYQKYLESNILKVNYKSFTQIVILGSASFTPFMQLTPADRRMIIENLLDIEIFSVMNTVVKQRVTENNDAIKINKTQLDAAIHLRDHIVKTIHQLEKNNAEKVEQLRDSIANLIAVNETIQKINETYHESVATIDANTPDISSLRTKHTQLVEYRSKIDSGCKKHAKTISFYNDNDNCPTCKQVIDAAFKSEAISEAQAKHSQMADGLSKLTEKMDEVINEIALAEASIKEAVQFQNKISENNQKLRSNVSEIKRLEDEIEKLTNSDAIMDEQKKQLATQNKTIKLLSEQRKELMDSREVIEATVALLKDGGIKTAIIRQYLPIINKLINKYLSQMQFFVDFNINEQFEETIKSRYRDEFSYQNFSEGEKMRINLAILFAWREVARMKNSVNTNLLILDEILDGSMDSGGTDEFIRIIKYMTEGTNTFVISHKTDQISDKFDKNYLFTKNKNFSTVEVTR